MQQIWELVLSNLINVGIGLAIFLAAYLSNMLLGIYTNVTLLGQKFDWNKILRSAAKIICVGFGIILLVSSVTWIVPFANANGLTIPAEYSEVIDLIATLGICLTAALKYIKEAWDKLIIILNGKIE